MPKNQPAMPQATLLRRSGKTIQPWGASEPVLACISISDDSMVVKLLLISWPALLYAYLLYYIKHITHLPQKASRDSLPRCPRSPAATWKFFLQFMSFLHSRRE